jgi:hypothetical protein
MTMIPIEDGYTLIELESGVELVQCNRGEPEPATRSFGPFENVPKSAIEAAGFWCLACNQAVEKLAKVHLLVVPRMIFQACRCGCVVTWEDEPSPKSARDWRLAIKLMKKTGVNLIAINQGKEVEPGFGGRN